MFVTEQTVLSQASQSVLTKTLVDVVLAQVTAKLSPDTASSGECDSSSQWVAHFAKRTLEQHRVRASTLEAYTLDIAMLSGWAAKQKRSLLGLTGGDLARCISERVEQGTQASTAGRHLSSWRRFYSFLVEQGALTASPAAAVVAPRVLRHEPRQVPEDVLSRMLRPGSPRDPSAGSAYRAQRDHAIVWTLYATGLGVSDVRLLRWPQIDEELLVINVPLRYGQARSFVLDTKSLVVFRALRGSPAAAGPVQGESSYCFPTASGMPMSRQALCHVVRNWARDCGWEDVVTPSMLHQTGRAHRAQRRQR